MEGEFTPQCNLYWCEFISICAYMARNLRRISPMVLYSKVALVIVCNEIRCKSRVKTTAMVLCRFITAYVLYVLSATDECILIDLSTLLQSSKYYSVHCVHQHI